MRGRTTVTQQGQPRACPGVQRPGRVQDLVGECLQGPGLPTLVGLSDLRGAFQPGEVISSLLWWQQKWCPQGREQQLPWALTPQLSHLRMCFLHPRGKWMTEKGGEWEDWAPPTLACSLWWACQGCQAQAGGGALHTHCTSEMYFANLL